MNDSFSRDATQRFEACDCAEVVADESGPVVVAERDAVVEPVAPEVAEGVVLPELPQAASRRAADNASMVARILRLSRITR
jgi:hypothetical protein